MHHWRAIVLLLFGGGLALFAQPAPSPPPAVPATPAEQPQWTIEAPDGAEFDLNTGLASATNGVVVRYGDATLSARRATVNQRTGEVVAEGDVRVQRQTQVWTGERIRFNFHTGQMTAEDFRAGVPPLFTRGLVLAGEQQEGVFVGLDGLVTTDDNPEPNLILRAKKIVVVSGDYVEARQATVYVGKVPVFWLPYFKRSLKMEAPKLELLPGYRSKYGPFLLTTYRWKWSEQVDGALHLDGRLERGLGVGPDFDWHLSRWGEGHLKAYYLHDEDPGEDDFERPIDPDRYRVYLYHLANPATNLTLRGMLRYQSDIYVTRDFFEDEYKRNKEPSTFLQANQLWRHFSLDVMVQPRVNEFFETVERLPEVKLTGFRQRLGPTPFFYESDSALGYYRRRFADGDTNEMFEAFRGDTFHQVVLPWTFFNWLNVAPRAGGRFTYYGEAAGPGATTEEETRGVFNTGVEVSTKASRLWRDIHSRTFQLDGLRHIVQPSINYAWVPEPGVPPRKLPQFDYEMPSLRLLPVQFPDYNAIDSIDSQNVLRFGLRNRLQTKRKEGLDDVVSWALYTDWRLRPEEGQTTFADVYSELDLKPLSWVTLSSELRFNINDGTLNEADHRLTFTPNDVWSLMVGNRYLRDDPQFGPDAGHNLLFGSVYYRFNEDWGARVSARFEAETGELEETYVSLYRDFRSWTGALTFRVRNSVDEPTDYTIALTMSLKAFPRYSLGSDRDRPELLLGY
jgi:lipopolysaccharide assembly outer membrane protein LptD (OstA)